MDIAAMIGKDGVNGVTYHADHASGHTRDSGLTSAWFGQKATLKQSALSLAVEMVGVSQRIGQA